MSCGIDGVGNEVDERLVACRQCLQPDFLIELWTVAPLKAFMRHELVDDDLGDVAAIRM